MTDLFIISLIIFMVLNILDLTTTSIGLRKGAKEGNPLTRWIVSKPVMMYLVKLVYVVGSIILTATHFDQYPLTCLVSIGVMVLFYGYVVYNNFKALK